MRRAWRIAAVLALTSATAGAQSTSSLAAWTAMMLSPAGALPPAPFVVDTGAGHPSTQIAMRAGQWELDSTDAVHNAFGLTVSRRLSGGEAADATLGYVRVACEFCKHWVFGGFGAQTRMRTVSVMRLGARQATIGGALRGSLGGGFTAGDQSGTALSAAASALFDARVPLPLSSWLDLSLTPGFAIGRLSAVDISGTGFHPIIGASVTWVSSFGLGLGAGLRHVQSGQSEPGVSVLWQLR